MSALAVLALVAATAGSSRAQEELHLHADGFLLRFDKARRAAIGAPDAGPDRRRFRPWPDHLSELEMKTLRERPRRRRTAREREALRAQEAVDERNRRMHRYTDDRRVVYLAGVTEHATVAAGPRELRIAMPLHDDARCDAGTRHEAGYGALRLVGARLAARLRGGSFTHVLVTAMGWHVGRGRAVDQFNRMTGELVRASRGAFRPLVIGVTWKSSWYVDSGVATLETAGHGPSYVNKLNDSDELGSTMLAYALHHVIRPAAGETPVVLVGHSMGARMLSRALHSAPFLRERPRGRDVALFIGLQPAFSINRYVRGSGREGWPYADFARLETAIVLTSAESDDANRWARWLTGSRAAGGRYGLRTAREHDEIFRVMRWSADVESAPKPPERGRGRVLVLDVGAILSGEHPHNDVLDAEMAALLWWSIRGLA